MNIQNLSGAAARSDASGRVSAFRHEPAIVERPIQLSPDIPTISPTPPPRPPRPSLTQILGSAWSRCRLVLAQRGLSCKNLLGTIGVATLLLVGGYWAYPSAAFGWHSTAAQADENRGNEQDAIREYTQMISLQPRNPEGYIHRARAYYTAFQYQQAIADETQVQRLTNDPQKQAVSLMWRGYDYDLLGDHARGIADFTASLAVSPTIPDTYAQTADANDKTPDAHKGRLWAYWRNKQYALAVKDCDALIAADAHYAGSYLIRGRLRRSMGDTAEARADLEMAYRRSRHLMPAYLNLIDMLEKRSQPRQALDVARAALRANPSSAAAWGSVGWFLYENGSTAEAIADDRRALSLDGSQDWVRYNLGLAFAV